MSVNKYVRIRYETLDKCFRNSGREYTLDDLLEECNLSLSEFKLSIQMRQLKDDIANMETLLGIDLIKERKLKINRDLNKYTSKNIYRYVDTNFSINDRKKLSETESNQLREALLTLGRFKGLPQYSWINELSTRLEADFNLKQESDVIISFEENDNLKGLEFIPELFNAIFYKKVLKIVYKKFESDKPKVHIFNPYYLKQYNMRWFLFGKTKGYETLTNLALDRIENIQEVDEEYLNSDIDFNKYFDDIIGVTKLKANIEHIVLEVVDKTLLPYLETKIIHVSQNIDDKDHIHLDVIPNPELESVILSFGEKVRVLKPQFLVEKLSGRIIKLKDNY